MMCSKIESQNNQEYYLYLCNLIKKDEIHKIDENCLIQHNLVLFMNPSSFSSKKICCDDFLRCYHIFKDGTNRKNYWDNVKYFLENNSFTIEEEELLIKNLSNPTLFAYNPVLYIKKKKNYLLL